MPARIVHAIPWNDHRDRSPIPWLLLVPLIGALLAAEAVDVLAYGRLPIPLVLASGVPAVVVATVLVMVSRRFIGGRRLVDDVALPTFVSVGGITGFRWRSLAAGAATATARGRCADTNDPPSSSMIGR